MKQKHDIAMHKESMIQLGHDQKPGRPAYDLCKLQSADLP